jgi:hypothetical protein
MEGYIAFGERSDQGYDPGGQAANKWNQTKKKNPNQVGKGLSCGEKGFFFHRISDDPIISGLTACFDQ